MATEEGYKEKATVTKKMIETDYATYCNVMPDQSISEPLIPFKNPLKQLEWTIDFGKGVNYVPSTNPGVYGLSVTAHYGSLIKGNVFAKDQVSLESGCAVKGRKELEWVNGRIFGNVVSLGRTEVKEPSEALKKQFGDWFPGDLIVDRNVLCESADIKGSLYVRGNLITSGDIRINPRGDDFVTVGGFIYSRDGNVNVSKCACKTIVSTKDVTTNESVVLRHPIILSRKGSINLNEDISIFDRLLCKTCPNLPKDRVKENKDRLKEGKKGCDDCERSHCPICGISLCEHKPCESCVFKFCELFRKGECTSLVRLTNADIMPYQGGMMATSTWRTFSDSRKYKVAVVENSSTEV